MKCPIQACCGLRKDRATLEVSLSPKYHSCNNETDLDDGYQLMEKHESEDIKEVESPHLVSCCNLPKRDGLKSFRAYLLLRYSRLRTKS